MPLPAHKPTDVLRAQVEALAGFGVIEDEIAAYIGVTGKTLRKYYRAQLDVGHVKANVAVARRLFAHATGDSVAAAIFWLKARAGWREKVEVAHSGDIGTHDSGAIASKLLPELAAGRAATAARAADEEGG